MSADRSYPGPRVARLWALLTLAAGYAALHFWPALVRWPRADGALGVLLGLYICSHPAANAVDLLFLQRGSLGRALSGWRGAGWLALNGLTMLAGWLVIVAGATRFTER